MYAAPYNNDLYNINITFSLVNRKRKKTEKLKKYIYKMSGSTEKDAMYNAEDDAAFVNSKG